jgi:hypothetical protein
MRRLEDELGIDGPMRWARVRLRGSTKPLLRGIFAMVAAGEIVHFASNPLFLTYPGVVYRPITDMPPIESALVWLASEETAAIRAFADAVRDTLKTFTAPVPVRA